MHVLHGGNEVPRNTAQRSVFVPMVHDCAQRRLSVGCHSTSEMVEAVPGVWKPGGDILASCLQHRDESVIPQAFGVVCAHTLRWEKFQALHPTRPGLACSDREAASWRSRYVRNFTLLWRSEACFSLDSTSLEGKLQPPPCNLKL